MSDIEVRRADHFGWIARFSCSAKYGDMGRYGVTQGGAIRKAKRSKKRLEKVKARHESWEDTDEA